MLCAAEYWDSYGDGREGFIRAVLKTQHGGAVSGTEEQNRPESGNASYCLIARSHI